jgi:hypothetical protein
MRIFSQIPTTQRQHISTHSPSQRVRSCLFSARGEAAAYTLKNSTTKGLAILSCSNFSLHQTHLACVRAIEAELASLSDLT